MEKFKIYGYTNLTDKAKNLREITITDSESPSEASTYNESWSISTHDKTELSFEIPERLSNGDLNPYLDLLKPEAVVALHLPNRAKFTEAETDKEGSYYRLKVVSRSPSFHKKNLIYSISCEDYASRVYAKQGEGLTLEKTGSLRELAEEILGETRKNNLYKNLNRDILVFSYHNESAQKKLGFEYKLPYINYRSETMAPFNPGTGGGVYASFAVSDDFVVGEEYLLHFDLIGMTSTNLSATLPFNGVFNVEGVGSSIIGSPVIIQDEENENPLTPFKNVKRPLPVTIKFKYQSKTNLINLKLMQKTDDAWPSTAKSYSISLANFKITKAKTRTTTRPIGDTALFINHLENFANQFTTSNGRYFSETRMSYAISNSNLYNALISLAELFNAQVKFDYLDEAFFFVSNKAARFKGYRLHPDINLRSISRPESSSDFATVFHLEGGGENDGVIPSLPKEWRMFLSDCVDKDFTTGWFNKYGKGEDTFTSLVPLVKQRIDVKNDSVEERNTEIQQFAAHMDKIPNFESTAYDFSYFNKIGLLKDAEYTNLMNILYNEVRKLNIKLNINSYKYYSIYSDLMLQLEQISFYVGAINTERKFQFNAAAVMAGPNAPKKYTNSWISYMNSLDASIAAEKNFMAELRLVAGLITNKQNVTSLDLSVGSLGYNSIMMFGYKNKQENGISKMLNENNLKQDEKRVERETLRKKQVEIEEQLADPTISGFVKESISVELAGVHQKIEQITTYIGIEDSNAIGGYSHPGVYVLESQIYGEMLNNLPSSLPSQLTGTNISLHELLYDRESKHNLINKKENALQSLMDKYEPFTIEARYQNSDEPTAYGLLEQGLTSFTKFNRPQISYNISSINIDALEEFKYYTHPEIGDKVMLDDELYFSYDNEETNHLVITSYKENLREPGSVSLDVEKDDESELLIKRMLEQTNFLSMGASKTKSSITIPVPSELIGDIPSLEESVEKLKATNISIISFFDNLIKK